jgi:hypothetical protein
VKFREWGRRVRLGAASSSAPYWRSCSCWRRPAAPPPRPRQSPLRQRVHIHVLDFSDFEVDTGAFKADLYLTFHCSRECDPHFDFRNGTVVSSQVRRDTGTEKEYRVRVELQEQRVNLRRFPFTQGTLPLEVEDDLLDEAHMVFEVEPGSAIDTELHLPGFELDQEVQAKVRSHRIGATTYSSVVFEVSYRSHRFSVAIKDLLPLALLSLAGLLSFSIDPEDTADRVLVTISALLALAFFGSSLTGKAPHTDYLTLADAYVISSLILLTAGLAGLIYIYDGRRQWDEVKALRVNRRFKRLAFAMWVAARPRSPWSSPRSLTGNG